MKLVILAVLLVTLLTMPALAYDWVTYPANGHLYALLALCGGITGLLVFRRWRK